MKTYDQKYFDAKANRRAGTTWLMLMFIVTAYYGITAMSGGVSMKSYIYCGWLAGVLVWCHSFEHFFDCRRKFRTEWVILFYINHEFT